VLPGQVGQVSGTQRAPAAALSAGKLTRVLLPQKRALQAVLADKSVVVSAPTGSGKTLVAEAAVVAALAAGKRAYYTTPLKALSNQKLREFRERFGCVSREVRSGQRGRWALSALPLPAASTSSG